MEEFEEYDSSENEIDSGSLSNTQTFNADLHLASTLTDADSLYIMDPATGDFVFVLDRIDCSDL